MCSLVNFRDIQLIIKYLMSWRTMLLFHELNCFCVRVCERERLNGNCDCVWICVAFCWFSSQNIAHVYLIKCVIIFMNSLYNRLYCTAAFYLWAGVFYSISRLHGPFFEKQFYWLAWKLFFGNYYMKNKKNVNAVNYNAL